MRKDTQIVEIFFRQDGRDNPGRWLEWLRWWRRREPNWYYYWGQLVPASIPRYYSSAETSPEGWAATWSINFNTGAEWITIYNIMRTDINYCTSKILHENKHHTDWAEVWPGGCGVGSDIDNDRINDNFEIARGWSLIEDNWADYVT